MGNIARPFTKYPYWEILACCVFWTSVSHESNEEIDKKPSNVILVWIFCSSKSPRSQHQLVANLLSAMNLRGLVQGQCQQGHASQQSALNTAPQLGASSSSWQALKVDWWNGQENDDSVRLSEISNFLYHYPEPQPNEMTLGTALAHPIKEMRVLLIGKKL